MNNLYRRILGFSLVELMVVISIVGILSGVAYPSYKKYITQTSYMAGVTLLQDCMKKVQTSYLTGGVFPSKECGVSKGTYFSINDASINTLYYDYDATKAWFIINFKPSVIPTGNRDLHIGGRYSATANSFVTLCGKWSSAYFTGGNAALLPGSCNDSNVSINLLSM